MPEEKHIDWSGEGLPPVGAVCEIRFEHWKGWESAEILCIGRKRAFVRQGEFEGAMSLDGIMFRPIRTAEQIAAAEEREKELNKIYAILCKVARPGNRSDMAEALYDAGCRLPKEES